MISTFTSDDSSNPLIRFLMLSDEERAAADGAITLHIDQLQAKTKSEGASETRTYTFVEDCDILSENHSELLCAFLEFMWHYTAPSEFPEDRLDLRLAVPDDEVFLELLGALDEGYAAHSKFKSRVTFLRLQSLHPGLPKIVLRMTRGPTNACINFHRDGGYANSTSQIVLNDGYQGGRLCFSIREELKVLLSRPSGSLTTHDRKVLLSRPSGSLTTHDRSLLHVVTSLTYGTCKSLFVVDRANGVGDRGVITVNGVHVQMFLAAQVSPLIITKESSDE
jgi:hypothetical protein